MQRHSFHNDFQQIKSIPAKRIRGIESGIWEEELRESPFVIKNNELLLDMKMNVRFFDLTEFHSMLGS